MATVIATAPPGGWVARHSAIAMIAVPTEAGTAIIGSPATRQTSSAIKADRVLPTMAGQGCARGLFGAAKISTEVAPNGAIR